MQRLLTTLFHTYWLELRNKLSKIGGWLGGGGDKGGGGLLGCWIK